MPSFLDYQESARKRTRRLVALWLLGIAGLTLCFCALAFALAALFGPEVETAPLLLGVAAAVPAVVLLATWGKSRSLGGSGAKIAKQLGGRRIRTNTRDAAERRLLNVVEEMAIASRVAVPAVFVLEREAGINAFAAGWAPDDAAVAVTRGALESLSREELQAVVGHEFSHILNGDMRLNIRLIGSIFGLVCIALFGKIVLRVVWDGLARSSGRRSSKDGGGVLAALLLGTLAGASIWLLGSLGILFGRLLQAAISRQREFLADASSVQFTRNPAALAGALKTIGAASAHGTLRSPHAEEIAHMLFADGLSAALLASHPPLDARIRRFEPGFDGNYAPAAAALSRRRQALRAAASADGEAGEEVPFRRGGLAGPLLAGGLAAPGASTGAGMPRTAASAVPPPLRDPATAPVVLCAALLEPPTGDPAVRAKQFAAIREALPNADAGALDAWEKRLLALPPGRARRAWCEIAATALRDRPEAERRGLAGLLRQLVVADGVLAPFEFAVWQTLRNRLLPPPRETERPPWRCRAEAALVLGALAEWGAESPASRAAALAAGFRALPPAFGPPPAAGADPTAHLSFDSFSAALDALRALPPLAKKGFLSACRAVVLADGRTTAAESDALYAISDTLAVPEPPPAVDRAPTA